jgi:hypothetical protein
MIKLRQHWCTLFEAIPTGRAVDELVFEHNGALLELDGAKRKQL